MPSNLGLRFSSSSVDVPCLRVILDCPTEIAKSSEEKDLKIRVTYDGLDGDIGQDAPPINFNKYGIMGQTNLDLYLHNGDWVRCAPHNDEDGGCAGFALVDTPPILVKADEDEQFPSLGLGESVVVHRHPLKHEIPEDAKPGDRFRLILKKARVEWWHWGDRKRKANTEVYLPCWQLVPVVDPPTPDYDSILCPETKNDGRPKLVINIDGPVEFTLT